MFHVIHNDLLIYKNEFLKEYLNINSRIEVNMYDCIRNKNVLIINNLGSLYKQQYESGKLKKIFPDFPDISSIQYIENGYTILNTGPYESIFDTVEELCHKINQYTFDVAIISTGSYSCLLADHIINNLNKNVFVIGGLLSYNFGVHIKRYGKREDMNENVITVPIHMRPPNYEKIEDGCYW
jgi:hypothetical protein